ncbi:hypothetical protein MASR1M45_02230 [Candidatus Kapaibacterium sp.]
MKLTVDISLYPLNEEFIPIIKSFIHKLEGYQNITIRKNNISTQISGEYNLIMDIIRDEVKPIFEKHRSVFVIKILAGDKLSD